MDLVLQDVFVHTIVIDYRPSKYINKPVNFGGTQEGIDCELFYMI